MRPGFCWLAVSAILSLWLLAPVRGQTPVEAPRQAAPPAAAPVAPGAVPAKPPVAQPGLEPSPLDTFLLRDSKGNLVPVLGMSFEEFEQLLQLKKGLTPAAAPDYTLDRLTLVGVARDQVVDLDVTATIRLRGAEWTRVPLGLSSAAMREPPKHQGDGEFFLDFDAELGGFAAWLKMAGRKSGDSPPHVTTLRVSVPLSVAGADRRLALSLPHATESSLRLTAAQPRIEAALAGGGGIVTSRTIDGESSEIAMIGAAGDLQLVWRPAAAAIRRSGQLDVNGEIAVRIQSERRITSDARLRVRGSGLPLEKFRVRLPPGMELLPPAASAGYSATPVGEELDRQAGSADASGRVVEVLLDKPVAGVAEVLLRASREADAAPSIPLLPARFEVFDAVRQRGTIDFFIDGQWQLEWSDDPTVHRIDSIPEAAAARFEYFQQPCGLSLVVHPRPARVIVEPTHLVHVEPQYVRVETLLKYHFRGARAAALRFDLEDWKYERVTPDALFDFPDLPGAGGQEVRLPVRAGASLPSELELKLEAHRSFLPDTQELSLTFPRPVADTVAPATIVLFAAENLAITADSAQSQGLTPDPTALREYGADHPRMAFRDFGGSEGPRLIANIRRLSRTVTVTARATVRVEQQQLQVEQTLDYRISHEPQRNFTLLCPSGLVAGGSLQLWANEEPLEWNLAPDAGGGDSGRDRIQANARADQIGSFRIVARYSVPLTGEREQGLTVELPLVLPAEEPQQQFSGQQLEFFLPEGMSVEPDVESFDEALSLAPTAGAGQHSYLCTEAMPNSRWLLQAVQATEGAPTTISQMWIQTWLTPQVRQERVAMRLTPAQDTIRIRLPGNFQRDSLQVALDARRTIPTSIRENRQVVVPVPAAARGRECVLELFFALEAPAESWGMASGDLKPAVLEDAFAPRRTYWQIALPRSSHLLFVPGELTSEMTWNLDQWPIVQRPVMDQLQLEAWMKSSRQAPLPRAANEYLYGTVGRWPTFNVVTVQRGVLTTCASGCVLLLGLLLLHVPQARHPSLLLVGATLLAGMAMTMPHTALLVAQSAVLGTVVTILATALAWFAPGRATVSPPQVTTHPSRTRESSYGSHPRPDRSSRITTTAPPATGALEARP